VTVIIVAPRQPNLPSLDGEVSAIARCLYRPIIVQGEVEERDILQAAKDANGEAEGFWFAGHATEEGLLLSNGEILPPGAFAQVLGAAGAEWSFLNSCHGGSFVDRLQASYQHDVYASIAEIGDVAAWRTAILVAQSYSSSGNIHLAYRAAALPGTTPLRYFPSEQDGSKVKEEQFNEIADELRDVVTQLREQNRVLTGDKRYREPGLIERVSRLEGQQVAVMAALERQRTWLIANSVLSGAVLIVELWLRVL